MDTKNPTVTIRTMSLQVMDTIIILFIMAHLVVMMVMCTLGFIQRIPLTRITEVQLRITTITQQQALTQMLLHTTQVVQEE